MLAILFAAFGIVMLIAELLLPTHGILGVVAVIAFLLAIGACFYINQYLGFVIFLAAALSTPFVTTAAMNIWPKTPVGRRLVLATVETPPQAPAVFIGQTGTAVGQLRPMGQCDFGDTRIEAQSEHGVIEAGTPVKVVAIINGRATVRRMESSIG